MASPLWCTGISVEIDDHPKSPTTTQHAGASVDIGPLTCRRSSMPFFLIEHDLRSNEGAYAQNATGCELTVQSESAVARMLISLE